MSKGLKALEKIKSIQSFKGGDNYSLGDKPEIKTIEKELKALEIIKKSLGLYTEDGLLVVQTEDCEGYWECTEEYAFSNFTNDEYITLKEVLCDEV